ncbi:hypothetical protein BU26DRAFT_516401 [Trematosphaeria pertusa]|uniref:Uncharacterized protein n=1 Tax=Trematosphaeria pertusa TaxID=390896 RepID=A0A6A6IMG2_9PLEO|nr:uncharacterized protein BU26DRAFT_516401 [Trematosphaeria pertusa]KAF2251606.1 hypothetical protein BU26DRAFT_516401 [Trematosphaeria pertusa]
MRFSTSIQTSSTTPKPSNDVTLDDSRLSITMTIEPSKPRKKPTYRAIQRPDGVIVEKPRYRPSSLTASTKFKFEQRRTVLDIPRDREQDMHPRKEKRMDDDLRGLRVLEEGLARPYENDAGEEVVERGRSGYNGPYDEAMVELQLEVPLRRFLRSSDPWSPYNRRAEYASNNSTCH